jgi:hypothetical protein
MLNAIKYKFCDRRGIDYSDCGLLGCDIVQSFTMQDSDVVGMGIIDCLLQQY